MNEAQNKRVFVIVNSYFIGDILLINPLIRNIKRLYDDAFVVMLTSPGLVDVAKYQEGVDDVVIWDRHGEHKNFSGMMKFIKNFPYKKVFASFPIYGMDRPIVVSWFLGSKYVLHPLNRHLFSRFTKSKYKILCDRKTTQKKHLSLLTGITKEKLIDCPMVYNPPNIQSGVVSSLDGIKYVTLCPISSKKIKDMPYDTVLSLIKMMSDYKVVLVGRGKVIAELSDKLKNEKLDNLIDLSNKTNFVESALVIKHSIGTISVDTGMMHLACALDNPVVGVFYALKESPFMPEPEIYKSVVIAEEQTPENILNRFLELIGQCS